MTLKRFLGTLSAAAIVTATPALADLFGDWDLDDDDLIDRDEFATGIVESGQIARFDLNDDGVIDRKEVASARYLTMDRDGDGVATVSEWDAWFDQHYGEEAVNLSVEEWDDDGDNVISRVEFEAEVVRSDEFPVWPAAADDVWTEDAVATGLFTDFDWNDDEYIAEDEIYGEVWN